MLVSHGFLSRLPEKIRVGAVCDDPLVDIVNIDSVHFEAVNRGLDDPVHPLILLSVPELDFAKSPVDRDREILKDLMIQILSHKESVVLVALHQDVFGLLGDDYREREAENDQDDKTGIGEELHQSKLPFLRKWIWTMGIHEQVPFLLKANDAFILLRKGHPVNKLGLKHPKGAV
jgi:hypothetical protein